MDNKEGCFKQINVEKWLENYKEPNVIVSTWYSIRRKILDFKYEFKKQVKRAFNKQGVVYEDTFDMDNSYAHWLMEIYPMFYKHAVKMIDLDYHKITHDGEERTFGEWLIFQIQMLQFLNRLEDEVIEDEFYELLKEIHALHGSLIRYLWW